MSAAIAPLTFGGQIRPEEVQALAARGVRALICARPDGEEPGQPAFAAIEAAARAAGLQARHVPVPPTGPGPAEAQAFSAALGALPGPVHAYCRSGGRAQAAARAAARLG